MRNLLRRSRNFLARAFVRGERDASLVETADRSLMLQGRIAAQTIGAQERLRTLSDASFKVTSQWGEDGIIEWIVAHLKDVEPSFIEFGVTYYSEANTRFLLRNRNWSGLIAEADASAIAAMDGDPLLWRYDLQVAQSFITRDNVNSLFSSRGFAGRIGLLSVDIDGNDYWIWEAIEVVDPDIVICEYNAVFGDMHPITVPYRENFERTSAHHSNLYWGTSIGALQHLAARKGYTLLGTNLEGCNAFFVRNDLAPGLVDRIEDFSPRPSRYRESRSSDGSLTYISGSARGKEIAEMNVVNVATGETLSLGRLGELYSEAWKTQMRDEQRTPR